MDPADSAEAGAKVKEKITTILVNNRPVEIDGKEATGREIKAAAGVPESFKLYGPDGIEIGDETAVKVHNKEKFIAISGQDVS
jgi:multiubiquitin